MSFPPCTSPILPTGRGAFDKALYLLLRRLWRKHRYAIEKATARYITDSILYDGGHVQIDWRDGLPSALRTDTTKWTEGDRPPGIVPNCDECGGQHWEDQPHRKEKP